jgi:hypothetical protein
MRHFLLAAAAAPLLSLFCPGAASACTGGRCYERVVTPPVYRTQLETVEVVPARVVSHVTPPRYGVVAEPVLLRPAQRVGHVIPPEIRTVAERVLVAPATRRWEVSTDAWGRTIGCWVDVPARYATRWRRVVTRPASVVEERIPPLYGVAHRTVLVRPARIHRRVIPPVLGTLARRIEVAPATASWRPLD